MWRPGTIILREYEVLRTLGRGGMATVYLVRQVDRRTLFAVKRPHVSYAHSGEFRAALAREVQAWSAMPMHPHVATCCFVREVEDAPLIFAEYVPEGTLATWLDTGRLQNVAHLLDLAIQITEAMLVAERISVAHRDLKPSNCLMDGRGLLKVTDFGLAEASSMRAPAPHIPSAASVHVIGTPEYCSPEQLDGRFAGVPSDLWSFGVLLLELLTRKRPSLGPAAPALLRRSLCNSGPGAIPPLLGDFLESLLQSDLSERPSSFSYAGQRLRQIYHQLTGKPYERAFPTPFLGDSTDVDREGGFGAQAARLLTVALREAGQDPALAERFRIKLGPTENRQASEMLSAIHLCKEAERLLLEHTAARPKIREAVLLSSGKLRADLHLAMGDHVGAVEAYGRIGEILQSMQARETNLTTRAAVLQAIIESLQNRAVCRRKMHDVRGAVQDYETALRLFQQHAPPAQKEPLRYLEANLRQNHSMALFKAGQAHEALEESDRSISVWRALARMPDSKNTLDLGGALLNRGVICRNLGQHDAALAAYSEVVKLAAESKARGEFCGREEILGQAYLNRAILHLKAQQFRQAKEDCDRAVELLESLARGPAADTYRPLLAQAYNNRSMARRLLKDLTGAHQDLDRTIEIRSYLVDRLGREDLTDELARAYCNKALLFLDQNQFVPAWPVCEKAMRWLESLVERKPQPSWLLDLGKIRALAGQVYLGLNKPEGGLRLLWASVKTYEGAESALVADRVDGWLESLAALLRGAASSRAELDFAAVVHSLEKVQRTCRHGLPRSVIDVTRIRDLERLLAGRSGSHSAIKAAQNILKQLASSQ